MEAGEEEEEEEAEEEWRKRKSKLVNANVVVVAFLDTNILITDSSDWNIDKGRSFMKLTDTL